MIFEVIGKSTPPVFAIKSGAFCAHSTWAGGLLPIQFKATSNPANDCDSRRPHVTLAPPLTATGWKLVHTTGSFLVVPFNHIQQPFRAFGIVPIAVNRQSENQLFTSTIFETKPVTGQENISAPDQYHSKTQKSRTRQAAYWLPSLMPVELTAEFHKAALHCTSTESTGPSSYQFPIAVNQFEAIYWIRPTANRSC